MLAGKTLGDKIGKRTANGVVGYGDGVERTCIGRDQRLRGEVIIDDNQDGEDRNQDEHLLVVWTNGSRNEDARVGAAAVYKHKEKWRTLRRHLGTNKEVFDTELYALGMALREIRSKAGGWDTRKSS